MFQVPEDISGLDDAWIRRWSNLLEKDGLFCTKATSRNKKLLGAPGIATRSKDATRGSWPYYYCRNKKLLTLLVQLLGEGYH